MEEVIEQFPGRKEEITRLFSLFSSPLPTEDFILFTGTTSTGKTAITREVMKHTKPNHFYFSCDEFVSISCLFDSLLRSVSLSLSSPPPNRTCSSFFHLTSTLSSLLSSTSPPLFLIFDHVEKSLSSPSLLSSLSLLPSLPSFITGGGIVVIIFISSWGGGELVLHGLNIPSPCPSLFFSPYLDSTVVSKILLENFKRERAAILKSSSPSSSSSSPSSFAPYPPPLEVETEKSYEQYLSQVIQVFSSFNGTNNILDLMYLNRSLWPVFNAPFQTNPPSKPVTFGDKYRHLKNTYKQAGASIFSQTITLSDLHRFSSSTTSSSSPSPSFSSTSSFSTLSYFTKFLLISAYLAAYNPTKTDAQYFSSQYTPSTTKKRRKATSSSSSSSSYSVHGRNPQSFSIGRLMSIFWAIVPDQSERGEEGEEDNLLNCLVLWTQIATLERLQLLQKVNRKGCSFPLYKCNIDNEFVRNLSKNVEFELDGYLFREE